MKAPMIILVLVIFLQCGLSSASSLDAQQNAAISHLEEMLSTIDEAATRVSELDVVFVLDDGSLSTPQRYWAKQLLLTLSEVFVIAPKYTWASVVTYNTNSYDRVPMSRDMDLCTFKANVSDMTLLSGASNLKYGLDSALKQHLAGRNSSHKLTIVLTTADWRNIGPDPENSAKYLKATGDVLVVVMRFGDKEGLLSEVFDSFIASLYAGRKLHYFADMTPQYMRALTSAIRDRKTAGDRWSMDLEVSNTKCQRSGHTCKVGERCVCDSTTLLNEYVCIGPDVDPPEALACDGPVPSTISMASQSKTAPVTWQGAVFTDNSGRVSTSSDKLPGLYAAGGHRVITTARDAQGNIATCTFDFTVRA